MALVPPGRRVGAESAAGAFGVKRVVFSVGTMSGAARRLLRKRLGSELDAVRDLMRKAESFRPGVGGGPSGEAGAAAVPGEEGRLTAAEPHPEATPMEVDGIGDDAKRRKVSPLVVQGAEEGRKRAAPDDERTRLAERLAALAASLPDHVVAFLQNRGAGDGDFPRALFQLKLLLDRFAPAESTPEKNRGRAAAPDAPVIVSCLSQDPRQDAASGKGPVEEKKGDVAGMRDETGPPEKKEGIGGGTGPSGRILLRDIAEEYGELVEAVGVLLLSPLPRSLVELAERGGGGGDEYVDICGDASPVVLPCVTCKAVEICSNPSSSSGGGCSGASSSSEDSDDTSWSSSDSSDPTASDSDENVSGPSRPPGFDNSPQKPAPMAVWIAEAEEIRRQRTPPTPTVRPITISTPAPSELPKESDVTAQIPEAMQVTKAEAVQNQCTAPAPTVPVPVPPKISSSPAALSLSKVRDTSSQPQPRGAAHSVELRNQRAVVTAPTEPPTNRSPHAPVPVQALPSGNGASAQPPPAPAPDAAHVVMAGPEEPHQDPNAAPASPAGDDPALTDLIARAQEAAQRRRREEINRERHRARQELVEMERAAAAVLDDRLRPQDMELLGIAAFEHVVSTVKRTAAPGSGFPTVMQFLGLFLKADEDEEREQTPAAGADMDVEEGEIC